MPAPLWIAVLLVAGAAPAVAYHDPATDCLAYFDGAGLAVPGDATRDCTDGDSACDADGTRNGSCAFDVRACVTYRDLAGCRPRKVHVMRIVPGRFGVKPPRLPASRGSCGATARVVVALRSHGFRPGKARIRLLARAKGRAPRTDHDLLSYVCRPLVCEPPCAPNDSGGPASLTLTVANVGSDFDLGTSGSAHNRMIPGGARLDYCLTGCDGVADPVCEAHRIAADPACTGHPDLLATPLPMLTGNIATCLVASVTGGEQTVVANVQTGAIDASADPLGVAVDVYQSATFSICPRCVAGLCDGGRNVGGPCRVDGELVVNDPPTVVNTTYALSRDCLPEVPALLGTASLSLPLTTGSSAIEGSAAGAFACPGQGEHDRCSPGECADDCASTPAVAGGIQQRCCTGTSHVPCFPLRIERTGEAAVPQPPWPEPTYPKTGSATLVGTFCVPSFGVLLADATYGLPGPAAIVLPVGEEWQ